jgi:integron integrase
MNLPFAIEQLRNVLRRQHKALATESNYVYWLRHYVTALESMPDSLSSEQKLERFLTSLARHRDLSASTQNQALNAILFFYKEVLGQPLQGIDSLRSKRPVHLRHAPSVAETQALLRTVRDIAGYPTNLIARLLYGCGLRVSEPLNLRIKDVNLERFSLVIMGAKGGKDRVVSLPPSLAPELVQQMEFARAVWRRDNQNHIPLMLPHQLARKFPDYQFDWPWAWLFPAYHTCRHPRTGTEVRYRMHEANVQRAIQQARRKLGISVLPHELRHGYATHCLENGVNPRAIQRAMGHASLETTMGYLHAESLSVRSPLETVMGDNLAPPSPT